MQKYLLLSITLLFNFCLKAQDVNIPEIQPQFFAADEEITITYNVTGNPLSSLSEAYLWMWLPDKGVDAPSNINPANSDESATSIAKFDKVFENGATLFRITITPSTFFNVDPSEITEIGMLLKGNDWGDGQTSDYTTEIASGFASNLSSPTGNYGFYSIDDVIEISAQASASASFTFKVDETVIETQTNTTTFETTHTVINDGAAHQLEIIVTAGDVTNTYNHSYTITPTTAVASIPAGLEDGINYDSLDDTTVDLVLRAPNKQHVYVIGDFNNWSLDDAYLMKKDNDRFWLTIENLSPNQEYRFQYLVDGEIVIADPYSEKISSPYDDPQIIEENRYPSLDTYPYDQTAEAVSYLQTNKKAFSWTDQNFTKPAKEDLMIYELLVRDFTEERTFNAVLNRLDYLDSLGINAIQFMPVMEFEGNLSWGYNPFAMTALDKFYGTEEEFKTLINEAHNRGIAVILDIALNHQFGRNSLARLYNEGTFGNPTSDNPWFNTSARHDFNVGYDMNHESELTQYYVDKVVRYWLEEYHIDGYRYDLSKGFTQKRTLGNIGAWNQYDASRVRLLKRLADFQWSVDPDSYVILEHFAENAEEKELANYGMMLWGNENHNFKSLARGNNANVSGLSYEVKGWDNPHVIGYMESHDEERVAWELSNSFSGTLAEEMQRLKINAALFFLVPGPKMLWQFGEFGYDEELNNDRLGVKPTKWEYLDNPERRKLFTVYQSLINLRTQTDLLQKENFQWSQSGSVKWIRYAQENAPGLVFVGNFGSSANVYENQIIAPGTWYDYFSGEPLEVGNDFKLNLTAGEFHILVDEPIENFIEDSEEIILSNQDNEILSQSMDQTIIFPNPANDLLHLNVGVNRQLNGIRLINSKGEEVKVLKANSSRAEIDLSDLDTGLYIIQYSVDNSIYQKKFIKN